jgi:multiple sugar transport system ATP-binding protein
VRPEAWALGAEGLPARLSRIERLGAEAILHAALAGSGTVVTVRLAPEQAAGLSPGQALHLTPRAAHLFDEEGLRRPLHATLPQHADHG